MLSHYARGIPENTLAFKRPKHRLARSLADVGVLRADAAVVLAALLVGAELAVINAALQQLSISKCAPAPRRDLSRLTAAG